MVQGFFYNSVGGDRKYNGNSVNESKRPFYRDGVFLGHLEVTAEGEEMAVSVEGGEKTGYAWINSHTIHNTTPLRLDISQASGTLDRIDRVVLRNDETERMPSIYVLEGAFSSTPIAPELTNTDVIQEKCLAEIYVRAGAVAVSQADIRDTRADGTLCGFVASQFEEFDFGQWQKQFDAHMNIQEQEWVAWLQDKKDILSGNVAGKLLVQIENLQTEISTMKTCKQNREELQIEAESEVHKMVHMIVKKMGGKTKLSLKIDDSNDVKLPNNCFFEFEIPKSYLPFELEVDETGNSEKLLYNVPIGYDIEKSGVVKEWYTGMMEFSIFVTPNVKEGHVKIACVPNRQVRMTIMNANMSEGIRVLITNVYLTL